MLLATKFKLIVNADVNEIRRLCTCVEPLFLLQSFHLQPTGTPGTYLLQTSSSQGLPLTLTTSPTVTLAAAAPASPEQIIVHALSVCHVISGTYCGSGLVDRNLKSFGLGIRVLLV